MKYDNLNIYAEFLLKEKIQELTLAYKKKVYKMDLPLLKFVSGLPKDESLTVFKNSLIVFLNGFINKQALEDAQASIELWKADKLPGIPRDKVSIKDIVTVYNIRKSLLIEFLTFYTKDLHQNNTIILELENLYMKLEESAFQTYIDIQKELLLKERELMETIINNSEDGILAFDKEMRVTIWNSHFEEITGIKKESIIGQKVFDVFPNYQHTEEGAVIGQVLKGEKVKLENMPFREYRKGFYEANLVPLLNNKKEIIGGVNIIRETTKLKIKEEEIRKSRDYYFSIFEDFPALIWLAGEDALCNHFNKTWLDFTGRTIDQEVGNGWAEGVHPEDYGKCIDIYLSSFRERKSFEMEYRLKRYDGEYRWIFDWGKPLYNIDGKFTGYIGVCFDITKEKESRKKLSAAYSAIRDRNEELALTEEALKGINVELEVRVKERTEELLNKNIELKKVNEELVKINADLDNFIYTASHDLKAPVSNIEGLVESLEDSLPSKIISEEDVKTILEMIHTSIVRFKHTIEDLSDITKIHKNEADDIGVVDVQKVIDDVKLSIREEFNKSKTILKIDATDCPSFKFSEKNFRSIIYNLISNSIKYRDKARTPEITVICKSMKGYVIISVKDNGMGFKIEDKDKLFKMFKRLHDHVEGTGVGLYIVKRIIDNNGGKIEVESQPGVGSTFTIFLREITNGKTNKEMSLVNSNK